MKTYLIPMFALVEASDDMTADVVTDSVAEARDGLFPQGWHSVSASLSFGLFFDDRLDTVELPEGEAEAHTMADSHPVLARARTALGLLLADVENGTHYGMPDTDPGHPWHESATAGRRALADLTVTRVPPSVAELASVMGELVRFAETRAEDLSALADEAQDDNDHRADYLADADRAWRAVETARALLARLEP